MMRRLTSLVMLLTLVFGFALVAFAPSQVEAHFTGGAHWHNYPGSSTTAWYNNCGQYSYYDNGTTGEPANCRWSELLCEQHQDYNYGLQYQRVDVYQLDGDFFRWKRVYNGYTC